MNNSYSVTHFIGKLVSVAAHGYWGEKPLAMLAMLFIMKEQNIRGIKACDMLKKHQPELKERFIRICKDFGSPLVDPSGSWDVINDKNKELRKCIIDDYAVDGAIQSLADKELDELISWYYQKINIAPLPPESTNEGSSKIKSQTLTEDAPNSSRYDFEFEFGRISTRSIEAWTSKRLQFQVKRNQKEFRDRVGSHLLVLEREQDALFHAVYMSAAPLGNADIENILIYNVEPARFSQIQCRSILFEFRNAAPPPAPSKNSLEHYYKYEIIDSDNLKNLWGDCLDKLIELNQMPLYDLKSMEEPERVWARCKEYYDATEFSSPISYLHQDIAMEVTIHMPANETRNVFSIIKPLIDGIISSFHYSEYEDRYLAQKVARQLDFENVGENKIIRWLGSQGPFVISTSHPVKHKGAGLAWHPDDHRCTKALINRVASSASHQIFIDVSIYNGKQ